jgi:hypothetical protein
VAVIYSELRISGAFELASTDAAAVALRLRHGMVCPEVYAQLLNELLLLPACFTLAAEVTFLAPVEVIFVEGFLNPTGLTHPCALSFRTHELCPYGLFLA